MPNSDITTIDESKIVDKINTYSLTITDTTRITPLLTFAEIKERIFCALKNNKAHTIDLYLNFIENHQARLSEDNPHTLFSSNLIKRRKPLLISQESIRISEELQKNSINDLRLRNAYVQCRELCDEYKKRILTEIKNHGASNAVVSLLLMSSHHKEKTTMDLKAKKELAKLMKKPSFEILAKKLNAIETLQIPLRTGNTHSRMLTQFFRELSAQTHVLVTRRSGNHFYSNFVKEIKNLISFLTGCFKTTGEEFVEKARKFRRL